MILRVMPPEIWCLGHLGWLTLVLALLLRKKGPVFSEHQPSARPHPLLVQSTNLKIQDLRDELELCSKSFLPSFKGEVVWSVRKGKWFWAGESRKQRKWKGTRTKNRGVFWSKVLYSGKHCALRPESRIKTQLCWLREVDKWGVKVKTITQLAVRM